jgi:hypothetical protein
MCNMKIVSKVLVVAVVLTGAVATAAPARPSAPGSRPAQLRVWSWLEAALVAVLPTPLAKALQPPQGLDQGVCIDPNGNPTACAASSSAELDRGVCIDPNGGGPVACAALGGR